MKTKKATKLSFFASLAVIFTAGICGAAGGFLAANFKNEIDAKVGISAKEKSEIIFANSKNENFEIEKNCGCEISTENDAIISAAEKISPAVVSIVVSKDLPKFRRQKFFDFDQFFNDPFSDPFFNFNSQNRDENVETEKKKIGGGTGFIFDEKGLILTNRHVVADRDAEFTIILNDGREFSAEILDRDSQNDIAVLQISNEENEKFKIVKLGESSKIKIGQRVIAVGNALAEFENTVTAGVISAKGRAIVAQNGFSRAEKLSGLIQTDAAINPGNSGGPLVNLNGEVVGINTAMANGANGIGFAIPIDDAKKVVDSILKHGKIVRPFLGVRFLILNENLADELKIPVKSGALLVGDDSKGEFAVIPGSPAEKAGLQKKDVILQIDEIEIDEENSPAKIISQKNVGDEIILKVWRGGDEIELNLKLVEEN